MSCEPTLQNLAFYIQGVTVTTSPTITYDYFVTGSLPSSASLQRVWQFQSQGTLSEISTLTLDYTAAQEACPEFNITFKGALNGTFIVHNQTFSANKYISYKQVRRYTLELTLKVPKSIVECFGEGTTQNYYFSVNINDDATNALTFTNVVPPAPRADVVSGVYATDGNKIVYAATDGGLSTSTDGGNNYETNTSLGLVKCVFVYGNSTDSDYTIYAGIESGLRISKDGGKTFTESGGLGGKTVVGVWANDSEVYAATFQGLGISKDGGKTFSIKTEGLGSTQVNGVYGIGKGESSTIYAATAEGLSISTDGGKSFTNYTTGLGSNNVKGVFAMDSTVYTATLSIGTRTGGLSISTDGGKTFTNKTTVDGLGSNDVYGVYATKSALYAATSKGLSISMDGGKFFTNYTKSNGLGSDQINGAYAFDSKVYAATLGGVSFSN